MHFFFTDVARIEHAFPYLLMLIKTLLKRGIRENSRFHKYIEKLNLKQTK